MSSLPEPIVRFLDRTVPEERFHAAVLLEQRGEMRLGPGRPWMPFTATQLLSAMDVRFSWRARFRMMGWLPLRVEDRFEDGTGRLDARLFGFLPMIHKRGPAIDRGEAQRYLAELAWCPPALDGNSELHFEEKPGGAVRAGAFDTETWVDLSFDEQGDLTEAGTATRLRDGHPTPWRGRFAEYRDFNGIRLPSFGEVGWETPEGPFPYWRATVTAAHWC